MVKWKKIFFANKKTINWMKIQEKKREKLLIIQKKNEIVFSNIFIKQIN